MAVKKLQVTLESDPEIMGGAICYKNTRVPIYHIAAQIKKTSVETIKQDYPFLSDEEIMFALKLSEERDIWLENNIKAFVRFFN